MPSSKEDIDMLANKVYSVITKSCEAACLMGMLLRKKDNIWWNWELASLQKDARRAWRKAIQTNPEKDWEVQKFGLAYFKKAVRRAKCDSWHSFPESMNSQASTARLVKIIQKNESVRVSNVIKHNGEFTNSPRETLNYLLDILSPSSQQTEDHANRYDLEDNPFMRPEDPKMIANICSFERMEAAINQFQPFKAPGPDGLYPLLLQKGWNQLKIYYHVISSMPETQLCAFGMESTVGTDIFLPKQEKKVILKLNPSA